jgi:hypothetical protein
LSSWKIENLGLCIKRSLQNAAGNINTPQELFTAIQDIWMSFTVDYIQNLYTDKVCRQSDGLRQAKDDYQGCHDISQHLYYHQPYIKFPHHTM